MPKVVKITTTTPKEHKRRVPDVTDAQREKRLCNLALDAVEERIRNGTATSAELVHFLRLASEQNRYEQEERRYKTELLKAKKHAIEQAEKSSTDYGKVLEALTNYGSTIMASEDEDYSDIFEE